LPQWGRMSCPQMVVHLTDACRMYLGDLSAPFKSSPVQYPPLKQLIVYVLPFPRGVPTARALLARTPGEWQAELDLFCQELGRMVSARGRAEWPRHPIFGRLSPRAYGVLAWRHADHHLRQFGV